MIDKDTVIMDLLKNCPQAENVLRKFNMGCSTCLGVSTETIEKAAKVHNVSVELLLKELKKVCS